MSLSTDLAKQFAKATNDSKDQIKPEVTHNGTIVRYNGKDYVQLDGSEVLTPISKTAAVKPDERVTVVIKNHTATVTGNISSPAARSGDVADVDQKVTELYSVVAEKATIGELEAQVARIDTLTADNVAVKEKLTAAEADIDTLQADNATISGKLTAAEASIDNLEATKIDVKVADAKYASIENLDATNANVNNLSATYAEFKKATVDDLTAAKASIDKLEANKIDVKVADAKYASIENLNATNANIDNLSSTYADFEKATADELAANKASIEDLQANKLSATDAELKYATIDFANINQAAVEKLFSDSGIIKDLIVSEGKITGELVGVTIKGDLIEGGTVIADKLVVKGENGLYYKLNTDGVTTEAEQTEYNSLNGSVITAKSITATKIAVDDLVAFDATIGGFEITENSLYSGVKASVDNTTRGIYLDNTGQVAFGDANEYLKYYKDADGNYTLEISARNIKFGASNQSIEEVITDVKNTANAAQTDVDSLKNRVTTAETNIAQNSDAIELRATKKEVESIKSTAETAQTTADNAQTQLNNKGLRKTVIDLLDTSTYDADTYYPVVGSSIPRSGYHTFEVNNQLESNSAPSWGTHDNKGFTCNLSARMIANGWGQVDSQYGWIDNASYSWCDKMPAYITQMEHSSLPVFYLRGGGRYNLYTDYDCAWSVKTDTYTYNGNTVAPTNEPSNYSKLVNNWDVVKRVTTAETKIEQNAEAISLRATKTEITEAVDNIQLGGRNLLVGTSNPITHTGTGSTNQSTALYKMSDYYNSITRLQGRQLTLSFDWETTATSGKFLVQLNDTPWSDLSGWITPDSSNQSGKSVYTAICYANFDTGTYTGVKIRSDNLTGTVTIKNAMLEFGNKASSWQTAPEDLIIGGRNYILNSIFEQPLIVYDSGASGWGCPQGVQNASIDSTFTYNGHNTLHKKCDYVDDDTWYESNYYFAGDKCIQFNPGETWTLSFWAYIQAIPVEPLYSSIRLFNSNWLWASKVGEIAIGDVNITEAKTWQHIEVPIQIPDSLPSYDRGYVMLSINQTFDGYMTEFKLEKGNKATDWTPAPEDVDADATSKANEALASAKTYTDAQLKITSDSITSTVSKTYATKTALDTTDKNVSAAQSTADAAKTAASNAQSAADTAQSTANTAKTNAATAQSTADAVKKNLADNYSTTTQMNSAIGQTAESITSTVSKTYQVKGDYATNAKVDSIQVGGRNLLINTNTDNLSWTISGGNGAIEHSSAISRSLGTRYDKFTITTKSTNWAYVAIDDPDAIKEVIRVGGEFTLSFDVFCDAAVTISDIAIKNCEDTNKVLDFGYFDTVAAEWTKITLTGKVISGVDYDAQVVFINLMPLAEESLIEFSNIKLEKGNKATDWTPAPEDMQNSIGNANDDLTNTVKELQEALDSTNETVSDIQNSQNDTALIVSENQTKISELVQQASGFTMNFTTINDTVTKINNEFVTERDERYKYIKFIDGEIWLGKDTDMDEDDFKLVIRNNRISFLQNNNEVAYLSNNQLFVTDIDVTNSLKMGNFVWTPRTNGNLALRWVNTT